MRSLNLDLLRTFLTIVDAGGFRAAGDRLGRTQAAISLQMRRLEDQVEKKLFRIDGRRSVLTAEGEVLLGYARDLLKLSDEARARLGEPNIQGQVRLGTPEDFATTHLPQVLARFGESHPGVLLEVSCDYTVNLMQAFGEGAFDLVLVKREPQAKSIGVEVWREPLVWVGADGKDWTRETVLPLVLSPPPDVYRKRAIAALDVAKRRWRMVYSSPSLAGLHAAVRAGLGVSVMSKDMVPHDVRVLGKRYGMPQLDDTEMALLRAPKLSSAGARLAEHIMSSFEHL
jgi:DNA-binding transcriptional LysR family regulator